MKYKNEYAIYPDSSQFHHIAHFVTTHLNTVVYIHAHTMPCNVNYGMRTISSCCELVIHVSYKLISCI